MPPVKDSATQNNVGISLARQLLLWVLLPQLVLWLAGGIAVATPWLAAWGLQAAGPELAAWFNSRWLNWLGWVTRKPFTEDYVPVFPWLGVMWWGMALGQYLHRRHASVLAGRVPAVLGGLAWLGRWSLSYYMLHQPVMIGALMLWLAVVR